MVSVGSPPLHWNKGPCSLEVQISWFFFFDPGRTMVKSIPFLMLVGLAHPPPDLDLNWRQLLNL